MKIISMTQRQTISSQLDQLEKAVKELQAIESQRRIKAGAQMPRDHDQSAKFQDGKLPTYNP